MLQGFHEIPSISLIYLLMSIFPVMELHPIFVKGFSGLSYPAKTDLYSDAPYKIWRNISNRVDIPINFFQGVKGTFGV